jgi:hypothetical protein
MRILKILFISAALGAFGAGAALAATVPVATTPGETDTVKPKNTAKKVHKRHVVKKHHRVKKHVVKHRHPAKKKIVMAKAPKKKPAPSTETETAPGSPPGSTTN